jgi:hypothetical protein
MDKELKDYFRKDSYFCHFFEEKTGIEEAFHVVDELGLPNHVPTGVVLEHIELSDGDERKKLEAIFRKIDFNNGDINVILKDLALALVCNSKNT